jgi:hypothetical protein
MFANLCINGDIRNLHLVHQAGVEDIPIEIRKRVNHKANVLLYFLGFAYFRANPYIVALFIFRLYIHHILCSKSEREHTCEYLLGHPCRQSAQQR